MNSIISTGLFCLFVSSCMEKQQHQYQMLLFHSAYHSTASAVKENHISNDLVME